MSIWKDKAGRYHVGLMVKGRRVHHIMPKDSSKGDAKLLESELRGAVAKKKAATYGDYQLTDIMGLYMRHLETLRSPDTAKYHAARITPWLKGHTASEARQAAAHFIKDASGHYADATINRSLGILKKALKLGWEQGYLETDYSSHVKRLPEHNARDTYLTLEQVAKLANAAGDTTKAAIWIALYTGTRRGEILKIKKDDIGRNSIQIQSGNTKTLKTRTVPIIPPLRPWLRYLPLQVNYEAIKSGFRRAREKVGMENVHFHDLRHSCASILIANGVDLFTVAKILGHTTIKTTERYAHMQTKQMETALRRAFR